MMVQTDLFKSSGSLDSDVGMFYQSRSHTGAAMRASACDWECVNGAKKPEGIVSIDQQEAEETLLAFLLWNVHM